VTNTRSSGPRWPGCETLGCFRVDKQSGTFLNEQGQVVGRARSKVATTGAFLLDAAAGMISLGTIRDGSNAWRSMPKLRSSETRMWMTTGAVGYRFSGPPQVGCRTWESGGIVGMGRGINTAAKSRVRAPPLPATSMLSLQSGDGDEGPRHTPSAHLVQGAASMRQGQIAATSQLLVTRKPTRPSGHRAAPTVMTSWRRGRSIERTVCETVRVRPGPRQGALGTHGAGLRAVGC